MKKYLLVLISSSAFLFTACSSVNLNSSAYQTSEPGSIDKNVFALLPKGSFNVTGEYFNQTSHVTTIEGYVNFGSDPDATDCESDYIISKLISDSLVTMDEFLQGSIIRQRSVRTAGEISWNQNISDPSKPGVWVDLRDPTAEQILFLFVPNIIVNDSKVGFAEGVGSGDLCSIPLMSRIMSLEKGEIVYDKQRSQATIDARSERYINIWADAIGLAGVARDKYINGLREALGETSFDGLIDKTLINIINNSDGSYEITQRNSESKKVSVKFLFTPTPERSVKPVKGVTYFDKITEEVSKSGLTPIEFVNTASDYLIS